MRLLIFLLAYIAVISVATGARAIWKLPIDKSVVNYQRQNICITYEGNDRCFSVNKVPGDPLEVDRMFHITRDITSPGVSHADNEDTYGPKQYPQYIRFPNGKGTLKKVDLQEEPDMDLVNEIKTDPANNKYILFTKSKSGRGHSLVMNDAATIRSSEFNMDKPTVVLSHGWGCDKDAKMIKAIKTAYLKESDVNLIVFDWSRLAKAGYVTATSGVPIVGKGLGQFLEFLSRETSASYDNMHLIGFNLGAHLVGNAGRLLEGKIARITGLDAAGPLWAENPDRLSSNDGVYVEAIHTNSGHHGLGIAIGHADFYPNGGESQPGCKETVCNHDRSWQLFEATITYDNITGTKCTNFSQLKSDSCTGMPLKMGNNNLKKSGLGLYRMNTAGSFPYNEV